MTTPRIFTQNGKIVTTGDGYVLSDQNVTPSNLSVIVENINAPGIHGPDTVYSNPNLSFNNNELYIGSFFCTGLTGPAIWSITNSTDNVPGSGLFLTGSEVITVGLGFDLTAGTYTFTLNATDGVTTLTPKNVTLICSPTNFGIEGNVFLDSQGIQDFYGTKVVAGPAINPNNITYAFSNDKAPFGNSPFGGIAIFPSSSTLTTLVGGYPVILTPSSGYSMQRSKFYIIHDLPPVAKFVPASAQLYSSLQPGDVVGRVLSTARAGIADFQFISNPNGALTIGNNGTIRIAAGKTLSAGTNALVFTARISSTSGLTSDFTVQQTILQGNVLSPSAMSLNIAAGLDNYLFNQVIGTPTVTGITGTPVWTMTSPDDCSAIYSGSSLNLFAQDAVTGAIAATQQLPSRTAGIPITVTVTDGPNLCRQTFTIPVAWKVGPTFHVGRGMAAAYGANGFEHFNSITQLFNSNNSKLLPANIAGATVYIHADSDPDYYANDNGGDPNDQYAYLQRFGMHGPVKFINFDPTGPRPRMGGRVGSTDSGAGTSAKAFLTCNTGDFIIDGLEISWCNGFDDTHGVSGIRKDADVWGDILIQNCDIHDNNNDFESGNGSYQTIVRNNVLRNFGTEYVSSGATHGVYCGACTYFEATGNLIYNGTNGHGLKIRAKNGLIQNNRIYDAEIGSLSCCIDICEGGNFVVTGNTLHKGPNSQNPFLIQYAEEGYTDINGNLYRTNTLFVSDNTILITQPLGEHSGTACGISIAGDKSNIDGAITQATLTNNHYFLLAADQSTRFKVSDYGTHTATPVINEVSYTTLSAMPALSFASPFASGPAITRQPFLFSVSDGAQNFNNFSGVQVDPGSDDIRLSALSAIGAVVSTFTAKGSLLAGTFTSAFGAGTAWSVIQNSEYYNFSQPWAPETRYAFTSNADGTGTLKVAGAMAAAGSLDYVQVRATGPSGNIADHRIYIPIF